MTAKKGIKVIATCAFVTLLAWGMLCVTACSKPSAPPENTTENVAPSVSNMSNTVQEAEKSVDAAQAAALIEAQRQEGQRAQENSAAALQAAYDENPTVVEIGMNEDGSARYSQLTGFTGTVRVKQGLSRATRQYEEVCMLVLPAEVTVTGTQYGNVHDDTLILDSSYSIYAGKIISVRLCLGVIPTSSIPSAEYSVIHGKDGYVTNVF